MPANGRRLAFYQRGDVCRWHTSIADRAGRRDTELSVYIAPLDGNLCRREGNFMSDFELLSIVMMILAVVVTLMVELFRNTRK